MVEKLESGKAPGLDLLNAELFKHLNDRYSTLVVKLFNKILDSGDFPEEWSLFCFLKVVTKNILTTIEGLPCLAFSKAFLGYSSKPPESDSGRV